MDNEEEKTVEQITQEDDGQIQRSKPRKYKPVEQDKRKKGNMKPRTEAQKRATAKMLESRKAKIANKKQLKLEDVAEETVEEVEEEISEAVPEVIKVKRTKVKAKPKSKPKPRVIYYESSESEEEEDEPEIIVKKYNKVKDKNITVPKSNINPEQQPKKNMSRFLLMKGLGF